MGSEPVFKLDFKYEMAGFRTTDQTNPEYAVGYDQQYITGLYEKLGFKIIEPIHFGSWCGRERYLNFQDIIVAQKK